MTEGRPRLGAIAIVGAGQVGTMIGAALKTRGEEVIDEVAVFDLVREVAEMSRSMGAADRVLLREEDVLDADTVVLAVPLPSITEFIERLGRRLRPGQFLIDTGSAKKAVVEAMRGLSTRVHAIGGHPLAGSERSGPQGVDPTLLQGAQFVLTPVRKDAVALEMGRCLATSVGAIPLELDAASHDRTLARTSHLAHVAAIALERTASADSSAAALRSSGYESTVRLARSDPEMVAGFLAANANEVRPAIAALVAELQLIGETLDRGADELVQMLNEDRGPAL